MPYPTSTIANYFIGRAQEEDQPITMLKLVKLCYIAHGWNLGIFGTPLIEETVQAWKYGPVIPSIYHEFKHFGRSPIDRKSEDFDFETFNVSSPDSSNVDSTTISILDKIWAVYKTVSGTALINRTHASGTPWQQHYKQDSRYVEIPDETIRKYYENFIGQLI